MISKGFYVDYAYINIVIATITIVFIIIVILCISNKYLWKAYDRLYGEIKTLEFRKKDDDSEYITDDEWIELMKEYGVELSVKPYVQITRNNAINLLEYLKEYKEKQTK